MKHRFTFRVLVAATLACIAARGASAQALLTVDRNSVDRRARAEVCARYPDIQATNMTLQSMTWHEEFAEKDRGYRNRAISVQYELSNCIWTNTVGLEKLEKRVQVTVRMDDLGNIPQGPVGVQTSTVTRSISREPPESTQGRMFSLNFRNAPLYQVVEFYSHLRGVPVAADPTIQREITCYSPSRLAETNACRFMEAVLAEQGIEFVPQSDGSLKVVEKQAASPSPASGD
jgi:hypothetical protein